MLPFPEPYNIRPMTLDDIPAVLAIEALVLPTPFSAEGYRRELEQNSNAHYAVLTADTHIIGYVGYWLIGDEAHISIIAIHPDQQRRRLGELLLLHSLSTICAANTILTTLEVRENNLPAQNLYAKYRFQQVGRRKRYYRDTGEDALIMTIEPLDEAYASFITTALADVLTHLSPTSSG